MPLLDWFRPPRQVVTLFFVAAVASTATLGWLTWQLLVRDRTELAQQLDDDRDGAVAAAALGIERHIASLERRLDSPASTEPLPPNIALVTESAGEFTVSPAGALPYFPDSRVAEPLSDSRLLTAEQDEIYNKLDAAATAYSTLTIAAQRDLQAVALARLARVQRKQKKWSDALQSYGRLSALDRSSVEGMPGRLVANLGRISIFEKDNPDAAALREEALRLKSGLERGEYRLTRTEYSQYAGEVRRLTGEGPAADADAWIRADALEWLWAHRRDDEMAARSRRLISVGQSTALVSWRRDASGEGISAVILGPASIRSVVAPAVPAGYDWSLADLSGRTVIGAHPPVSDVSVLTAATTGLPWTLHIFRSPTAPPPGGTARRSYLLAVLASVAAILLAAWYFIWRGIRREARVARLQSDFVAAVSHEFRSPLTSLRHLSELLATNRMVSDERKQRAYTLLLAETDRLGRLVEGLLDFGRLQNGSAAFRFEPVNVPELTREIVDVFSRRLEPRSHQVELVSEPAVALATADREALGRVLWNLLDNAVKYSPDAQYVRVGITTDSATDRLHVSVTDAGIGIPPGEQPHIFDRFVRGADAKARRIGGTGIGLSLARDIMRAHAGDITVISAPGQGSTFTVTVPLAHV
jgi:signal transduction histidine kinase